MVEDQHRGSDQSSDIYELCVIGAGIAGMNALVVASDYLPRSAKVALVDSRPRVGGMWIDTYDHVQLHQPHPIFTAGNIRWTLNQPPSHLATKPEILAHFEHCFGVAKDRVDVDERFGWEYESHEESGDLVEVTLRAPDGQRIVVITKRLIKAFGHRVALTDPLPTTSSRVRSITPEQLVANDAELRADSAPIWIIGSGKTAMDAAQLLITRFPGREVNMLAGPGTMFARRDVFFPVGAKRWFSGTPINTMLRQVGRRFDGTNEDEVLDWYRPRFGISPTVEARDFFSAYLSDAECALVKAGLATVANEYFADAVDRAGGVDLVMRSGDTRAVEPGTWLVNCTGSLLRDPHPYEPYASSSGRTLSLQMRSSTTGAFSGFAAYYLTHLMFTEQLREVGLYELDLVDLYAKAKPLVVIASMSLSLHNLSLFTDALSTKALLGCGLDYDRWYPMPRRLLGNIEFLRTHRRDRAHHRRALDTLRDRFDVRCGPLEH